MDKNTFVTFAKYYLNLGLDLTYINLKNNDPSEPFITEKKGNFLKIISGKITEEEGLKQISDFNQIKGLGVQLENTSLLCIDIDYSFDEKVIKEVLKVLRLPSDYEWVIKTGSGFGYHIIICLESLSLKEAYFDINSLEDDELSKNFLCNRDGRISHVKKQDNLINFLDFINILSIPEENDYDSNLFKNENPNIISFRVNKKYRESIEKIQFLNDKHSILPPSSHKSGGKYTYKFGEIPSSYPKEVNTDNLFKFIYKFCIHTWTLKLLRGYVSQFSTNDFTKYYGDHLSIIIDFETTGLINGIEYYDLDKFPSILQVSWLITDGQDIILSESSLNSEIDKDIPESIEKLTGINKELCKDLGRPLSTIAKLLINDLKKVSSINAYNLEFDISCMKHLFFKTSQPFNFKHKSQVCLLRQAFYNKEKFLGYNGDKWLPLETLFKLIYPNSKLNSHNSLSDIFMAYKIYKILNSVDNEYDKGENDTKHVEVSYNISVIEDDDLPVEDDDLPF